MTITAALDRLLARGRDRWRPATVAAPRRIAIARGEELPPEDPVHWCAHGIGAGPLDGVEEWGQAWGAYYVGIWRHGGASPCRWAVSTRDAYPCALASGTAETLREAGATVRSVVQLLVHATGPAAPGGSHASGPEPSALAA